MANDERKDRIVLITGGAGGVGRTVTLRWLAAGASVVVADRAQPPLDELASVYQSIEGADPARLALLPADVTTPAGAEALVARAEQVFGRPADTLLHLVGGFAMGAVEAPDAPEVWERLLRLNLDSAFYCYRAALPALRARGGGWIVGMAARAAVAPAARLAAYAASKAGLIALTQALSDEVRRDNIHVNVLLPSTIDTPANRKSMGEQHAKDWVTADDIADATLFLCSERAHAVHGATLEIYGNA